MQIIPSIDTDSVAAFSQQIDRLLPYYQRYQIDYADGLFVPFKSISLPEAISALEQFASILMDIHLMTKDIQASIDVIEDSEILARIETVFIHHAASPNPKILTDNTFSYKYGLVLNPEDSVDTIKHTYDLLNIENIQLMTINPGPQGSPFLPDMLNKIEQLRLAGYKNNIFLDGGVNDKTLKIILTQKYLPDFVCPGSFFSQTQNIEERVQYLSKALNYENHSDQSAQNNN